MSDTSAARTETVRRRLKQAHTLLPEIKVHKDDLIFGGCAWLSRWLLDHPEEVRGKRVIDIASGSGVLAIAAAMAGAADVIAVDIDPSATAHTEYNARANNVNVRAVLGNALLATHLFEDRDVITVTDAFYDKSFCQKLEHELLRQAQKGKTLLTASWNEVPALLSQEGELLHINAIPTRSPHFFRKIIFPQAKT